MLLPQTEIMPDQDHCLDAMPVSEALSTLLAGQVAAVDSLRAALAPIEEASQLIARTLHTGGVLHYVAAGSSGLMALADGSELPGTFGVAQEQISIFMAGGVPVDGKMPGDTEDDTSSAAHIVDSFSPNDLVIALSASGRTPFPCEISRLARAKGVKVVALANNASAPLLDLADVAVFLPTPPEVLAGSTRLGAGTAQKITLNMMSTMAGVILGHVHNGLMVNLHADNAKLRQRAIGIVAAIADVSAGAAREALEMAGGNTKLAVLLALDCERDDARQLLKQNDGHLRPCIKALTNTPIT